MSKFEDTVRRSIRRDFAGSNLRQTGKAPKRPHPSNVKRIISVEDSSNYAQYRLFLLGKLVRLVSVPKVGWGVYVEFVNEQDRKALNAAAWWSDAKKQYLLDGVKFDD